MSKKNHTWKLDETLISELKKFAKYENRSLTNFLECLFIKEVQRYKIKNNKK